MSSYQGIKLINQGTLIYLTAHSSIQYGCWKSPASVPHICVTEHKTDTTTQ
jgi:hypothetical protein